MSEEKQTEPKHERLYRSKVNRTFAGVCGGIAEFFKIDPLIIRLGWIVTTLFAGAGIIAYIAALFIIPENPKQEHENKKRMVSPEGSRQWGIILIVIGVFFLLGQLQLFHYFNFHHFQWQTFLAFLLISYGVYLIFNRNKNTRIATQDNPGNTDSKNQTNKGFYRISVGKMIAGVCSGLSSYFNIDVTIIRLIWVVATLASGGLPIIAYIAAILIFPIYDEAPKFQPNGDKS